MDEVTTDCGALAEAVVFLNHFKDMPDPRQRGKILHPLAEVLLLALLAVLPEPNPSSISPGSVA
jgi:hypothetical protein